MKRLSHDQPDFLRIFAWPSASAISTLVPTTHSSEDDLIVSPAAGRLSVLVSQAFVSGRRPSILVRGALTTNINVAFLSHLSCFYGTCLLLAGFGSSFVAPDALSFLPLEKQQQALEAWELLRLSKSDTSTTEAIHSSCVIHVLLES